MYVQAGPLNNVLLMYSSIVLQFTAYVYIEPANAKHFVKVEGAPVAENHASDHLGKLMLWDTIFAKVELKNLHARLPTI